MLVERYLQILRTRDISVDQIVAITFTNRAANEMRERLRTELDKLLLTAAPGERAKWMRHKRTLEGAIITTIHGLCSRLLREFPVEADIDPQFALLDAHQSAMLEESVVEETLTEFISANNQAITELAAGVGRVRLARGLIDIYRSMRNQGLTVARLHNLVDANHATVEDYKHSVDALKRKLPEFINNASLPPSAREKRTEAEHRWPALQETLLSATESTSIAEFTKVVQGFRTTRPTASQAIRDLVTALDELIWKDKLGGRVPQTFFDLHARRYAAELIQVVKAIESRLDEEKRRRSSLDFDDLQVRALKLLETHPEVLRRTSSRYRFFLVDEFQDTNSLQRDLMVKLALGSTDFRLSEQDNRTHGLKSVVRANLFIVGDRKQSIYGFRGADVDVFREMTSRIESQDGLPVTLNQNFRSQRSLINCFNLLFNNVFEREGIETELNEIGYVQHEPSVAAREDEDACPVVELLIDVQGSEQEEEPNDISTRKSHPPEKPRERDAEQIATRIISLAGNESISSRSGNRAVEYRDIALLFRAMTEVHLYEAAFRRAGIPYVTVDGKGFYAREEITDFVQLLRFLDNKTDEVALVAVLRSPICGLSDDTLLALRWPVKQKDNELPLTTGEKRTPARRADVRPLLDALRSVRDVDPPDGHAVLRAGASDRLCPARRRKARPPARQDPGAAGRHGGDRVRPRHRRLALAAGRRRLGRRGGR